jgi:hypothetical protein
MSDVRGGSAGLPGDPPGGRRALAVWGIGVSVYFVAVIFRTSLGVAGLDAADRFHVNASALSTFSSSIPPRSLHSNSHNHTMRPP